MSFCNEFEAYNKAGRIKLYKLHVFVHTCRVQQHGNKVILPLNL